MTDKKIAIVGASNTVGLIDTLTCVDMFIAKEGWTPRDQYYGILPHIDKLKVLIINPDGNGGDVEVHFKYVQGMLDIAKRHGVKTMLLNVGPREGKEPINPISNKFNRAHKAEAFENVDEYVDIRSVLEHFVIGRHWTQRGKERVANLICAVLTTM